MKKLDYLTFTDDPLFQRVNITIRQSDIIFLNIKEVTEDDTKPVYILCSMMLNQSQALVEKKTL